MKLSLIYSLGETMQHMYDEDEGITGITLLE